MKLIYLIKRLFFRLKDGGFKSVFHEIIFLNRKMVIIEKQISHKDIPKNDLSFIYVTADNYNQYKIINNAPNFEYYCKKRGAHCMLALQNDTCVGFQWWVQHNDFIDIKKLSLNLTDHDAYLFDLFIYPEYRGTKIPALLSQKTFNVLFSNGINRIYGFYFSDNLKSLWWHRAILKCREIGKVNISRFLIFELANGRIFMNI